MACGSVTGIRPSAARGRGRSRVIHGGDSPVGAADRELAATKLGEGLRRGDFVNEL